MNELDFENKGQDHCTLLSCTGLNCGSRSAGIPPPAFIGVAVEEVGVAALLEDGGQPGGLVVVQLDLAVSLQTSANLLASITELEPLKKSWTCQCTHCSKMIFYFW
jgi:hypothetical protein